MTPARLSIALSGGAALGAYQAGATAALLTAVERLRDHDPDSITFEAVGGASAGALVGLLAATAHCTGLDPVDLLHRAWVDEVSMELLVDGSGGAAPMGTDALGERLRTLLAASEPVRAPSATAPVAFHVALTGLRGLRYDLDGLRGARTVDASTYADWTRHALAPGLDRDALVRPQDRGPVAAALASAANPGVFPSRLLDRSDDRQAYEDNGVHDLPEHGRLWFTDGGVVQTAPVGRVLAAARAVHGSVDGPRAVLLVDPRSEGPSTGPAFADTSSRPGWLSSLARTLSLLPAQALYDDLRRVQRDNRRLEELDALADRLVAALPADATASVRAALGDADGAAGAGDAAAALRDGLRRAAGLDGKDRVLVDVLSPLLLVDGREGTGVDAALAGSLLGDLGGFLHRDLRHSDFVLGWATTLAWLPDGLAALGVDGDLADDAVEHVAARHEHDWRRSDVAGTTVGDLSAGARLRLVELALSSSLGIAGETARAVLPASVERRLRAASGLLARPWHAVRRRA